MPLPARKSTAVDPRRDDVETRRQRAGIASETLDRVLHALRHHLDSHDQGHDEEHDEGDYEYLENREVDKHGRGFLVRCTWACCTWPDGSHRIDRGRYPGGARHIQLDLFYDFLKIL